MFAGHFGVAFGLKRWTPQISLGVLFLAAQWVDLIWPTLLMLGVETVRIEPGITVVTPLDFEHYPWSHSLLAVLIWGGLFAAVYRFAARSRPGAWLLGLAVVSHWLLDLLMHRPDLPILPAGPWVGFGGWNHPVFTLLAEACFLGGGVWLYLRTTCARDAIGRWGCWGLVAFLAVIQVSNQFGPPPPDPMAIAWVGQAQWLLVAWAFWIDRHRETPAGT